EWSLQDELTQANDFAPFVCAGLNGSGKSNLLEALAAIFYHMECIYLENLPDSFRHDEEYNPKGFRGSK
ncbi:ABC transporter, partial [Pseudomonas aeruginosa]